MMMKRIQLKLPLLLNLIFFIVASGCNVNTDTGNTKIGVILSMTGELASYSAPMKQGMDLAAQENGKDKSNPIELKYADSKAEAKTAVGALMQMSSVDKINYFIGDISSTTTLAMIPVIESNKAFLLSPGASSPKLSGISQLFARNYPSSLDESLKSAEYGFNVLKKTKAIVVYVNSEFGIGLKDAFVKRFQQLHGTILSTETYDFGNVDFRTLIIKLKSAAPDLIYLAGNQKEMGNFMKQLKESGYNCSIISNISFLEPDCLNIAQSAAEGVMVPVAYYNPKDTTDKSSVDFSKLFKQKYHTDPTAANAVGYDAVTLIYAAIKKVGNDPQKVAAYIRNLKDYNGALGKFSFENGDINMKTVFKIIKDGKPVDIK